MRRIARGTCGVSRARCSRVHVWRAWQPAPGKSCNTPSRRRTSRPSFSFRRTARWRCCSIAMRPAVRMRFRCRNRKWVRRPTGFPPTGNCVQVHVLYGKRSLLDGMPRADPELHAGESPAISASLYACRRAAGMPLDAHAERRWPGRARQSVGARTRSEFHELRGRRIVVQTQRDVRSPRKKIVNAKLNSPRIASGQAARDSRRTRVAGR